MKKRIYVVEAILYGITMVVFLVGGTAWFAIGLFRELPLNMLIGGLSILSSVFWGESMMKAVSKL